MITAYAVIPKTETLISVVGTTQQNAENLSFQGLTFEYTTWLSPNSQGYIENQGGSVYRPLTSSQALKIFYSNNILIEGNRFLHLGRIGINAYTNQKLSIIGNHLEDISGIAINSNADSLDNILNNYITNVANEYQSASALRIDMKDTKISHNEIHDVSYTGIEPLCLIRDREGKLKPPPAQNIISNNLIYNVMKSGFDGGGIHTRCAQEGTKINQNVLYGQPSHVIGFIYVDFYSGFLEIAQNVIFNNDTPSIFLYLTGNDYVHDNWLNPKPYPTGCLNNSDPCYRPYNPNPYENEKIESTTAIHSLSDAMAIPAAAAVVNNAGLESAYKDIKNLPDCIAKNTCLAQLPSPTPTPTPRPSATPTPTPGSTITSITIGFDGIGVTKREPLGGNINPKRRTRTLEIKIYKASDNSLVFSNNQAFTFNSATNRFDASISLPSSFETGIYNLYVLGNPYLSARYPGSVTITKGETIVLNSENFNLTTGDVNRTTDSINKLNILDYNVLISCSVFSKGDSRSVCSQNPDYLQSSDLDDDGKVDQYDYNLFLRELSVVHGD